MTQTSIKARFCCLGHTFIVLRLKFVGPIVVTGGGRVVMSDCHYWWVVRRFQNSPASSALNGRSVRWRKLSYAASAILGLLARGLVEASGRDGMKASCRSLKVRTEGHFGRYSGCERGS